jgi:hypothetical protein
VSERSYGRQYPDGPLKPPPGWPAVTLKIPADPEMVPPHYWDFYDEPLWAPVPDSAGGFLHVTLGEYRPPAHRIEITAEFCQCAACKRERCEP